MRAVAGILGLAAFLFGLFFAAQGAGIIPWPQSSFMVNQSDWVLYGLVIAAAGLVLMVVARRMRR